MKNLALVVPLVLLTSGQAIAGLSKDAVMADHPRGSLTVGELEMGGAMEHPPSTKETLRGWILRSGAIDYTVPAAEQAGLESSADFLISAGWFKTKWLSAAFFQREVLAVSWPSREQVLASLPVIENRTFVSQIVTETAEEAEMARGRVLSGESFEAVAREMSGGINGFLVGATDNLDGRKGCYTPEEEALLAAMKPGEISAVVPGPLGFSVFRVVITPAGEEEKRFLLEETEKGLYARRVPEREQEVLARLRAAARIVIHDEILADPPLVGVPKYPPVVAEVDGQPVFYNQEFATPRKARAPLTAADRGKVLERVIRKVLYAREGERLGYGREPEFAAQFEPLRRTGLWRAWLARLEEAPPVSREEIVAAYGKRHQEPAAKKRKKVTLEGIPAAEREKIAEELRARTRRTVVPEYIKDAEAQVAIHQDVFEAAWEAYRPK